MDKVCFNPAQALLIRECLEYWIEDSGSFPAQIITDTPKETYQELISKIDNFLES